MHPMAKDNRFLVSSENGRHWRALSFVQPWWIRLGWWSLRFDEMTAAGDLAGQHISSTSVQKKKKHISSTPNTCSYGFGYHWQALTSFATQSLVQSIHWNLSGGVIRHFWDFTNRKNSSMHWPPSSPRSIDIHIINMHEQNQWTSKNKINTTSTYPSIVTL